MFFENLPTLYKWAQPKGTNTASGIPNPLDGTLALTQATSDPSLIHWLCRKSGGFFVENPKSNATKYQRLVPTISRVVKQFADLLSLIAHAASDSEITDDEAREAIYGMPYVEWKEKYQERASDAQMQKFEETKPLHAEISGHN
mgnify:CR=1 FL=1